MAQISSFVFPSSSDAASLFDIVISLERTMLYPIFFWPPSYGMQYLSSLSSLVRCHLVHWGYSPSVKIRDAPFSVPFVVIFLFIVIQSPSSGPMYSSATIWFGVLGFQLGGMRFVMHLWGLGHPLVSTILGAVLA